MRQIVVIGGQDHASEIVAAAQLAQIAVRGIYDDDSSLWGRLIAGVPVKGPMAQAAHAGVPAVIAYADASRRQSVAAQLQLTWQTVIHPLAIVDRYCKVASGSVIFAGAVVQPGARVGAHVIVGAKATLAHDCLVDDFANIAPGVQLAGFVRVGQGATLEDGAVVIPNMQLGCWSWAAAGAVIIDNISDHARVGGIPARPLPAPAPVAMDVPVDIRRMQTG